MSHPIFFSTTPHSPRAPLTASLSTSNLPSAPAASTQPLFLTLTRSQYATECGGVLIDPSTNEVCLLFYPDTSEWRLPMGRPNTMAAENCTSNYTIYTPSEQSVAGCEPLPHAAQRLISAITGYRCSHLHPTVLAHAAIPCAYMGPQMVEPLTLQIEQRIQAINVCPSMSMSSRVLSGHQSFTAMPGRVSDSAAIPNLVEAAAGSNGFHGRRIVLPLPPQPLRLQVREFTENTIIPAEATPMASAKVNLASGHYLRQGSCQYVMSYYYMAWITQNRFEPNQSALPVGLAIDMPNGNLDSTNTSLSSIAHNQCEVAWFKMDTAAQMLSHNSDRIALQEAIHRISRFGDPRLPFSYSAAVILANSVQQQQQLLLSPKSRKNSTPKSAGFCPHCSATARSPTTMPVVPLPLKFPLPAPVLVPTSPIKPAQPGITSPIDSGSVSLASSSSSLLSSAELSLSENVTNTNTAVGIPTARNIDIIRRATLSLGKRGGMLVKAVKRGKSTMLKSGSDTEVILLPGVAATTLTPQSGESKGKSSVPRFFSIFNKYLGSSA
ncbi:hypothetical protein LPJ66_000953 [Kickxella alabastrina]|uniref:Uncharacterized protein n=1 Tax=Kickxella alabastrina TaxID=61397 RepID=A0ACC1IUP1_9FUNG|nr:hypothetical protein LPJ66_000953 [Kickxella alabastrina]